MNRSRLAALSAGAMFLVASLLVPATALAAGTGTIKVLGAPTFNPAVSSGSFTVQVVANASVTLSGASAALSFDNTKLTLTALSQTLPAGANAVGFDNSAAGISAANTAGQIPVSGWFYISGSAGPVNTDLNLYSATFSITASGDSTLAPSIGTTGGLLDGTAGANYGSAVSTTLVNGTVLNTTAPIWTLSAPATASVLTGASSAGSAVSTAVSQGTPGVITFSATGLPSGVTAAFSPTSVTNAGSSTLTFTATAAAAPGTYSVTVTGTDASAVSHSQTISLSVVGNNDFSVSAAPTTGSVTAGGAASSAVTVSTAILTGTPGTITFTTSALPSGVTATFTPASASAGSSSALTFLATAAATAGSYPITISGNNGTYTHTAAMTLNVTGATPVGGQNVNVNGTLDAGFLGLTCPSSLSIGLLRGNTNQVNVPCQVYTNTVWNLNVTDTATDAYKGYMVTGRPVNDANPTGPFHMADSMHVLSGAYLNGALVQYANDVDLSVGGTALTGTNSASAPLVLSQFVRSSTHPGTYGIQVLFSAVSVF